MNRFVLRDLCVRATVGSPISHEEVLMLIDHVEGFEALEKKCEVLEEKNDELVDSLTHSFDNLRADVLAAIDSNIDAAIDGNERGRKG